MKKAELVAAIWMLKHKMPEDKNTPEDYARTFDDLLEILEPMFPDEMPPDYNDPKYGEWL